MQFDIGALVIVCLAGLIGFVKGFWSQVISLAAAVGAGIVAYLSRHKVADVVMKWVTDRYPEVDLDFQMIQLACSILLFCLVYFLAGSVMEMIKRRVVSAFAMKMSDRFFGLIAGVVKGALVVLVLIVGVELSKRYVAGFASEPGYDRYEQWLTGSRVYEGGCRALATAQRDFSCCSNAAAWLEISFDVEDADSDENIDTTEEWDEGQG